MSAPPRRSSARWRRAKLASFTAALLLGPLAFGAAGPASALLVSILAPADGSWTANASATVWGTVGALGNSTQTRDSALELAAGTFANTTLDDGAVALAPPATEAYSYFQNFTGLEGVSRIDGHWPAKISQTAWAVTSNASAGATPPALVHTGNQTEKVFWTVVLPGPAVNASLTFVYACQANANLIVALSPDGFASNETTILSTGSAARTTLNLSLAPTFDGVSSFFVWMSARATNASQSACLVDDFAFLARFVPSAANPTYSFADDFSAGENAAWDRSDGVWQISSGVGGLAMSAPPAMYHTGVARHTLLYNLAFVGPIRNATLEFTYQTQNLGRIAAYLGGDGPTESAVLADSIAYPSAKRFSIDVTAYLQGGHSLRLRFEASGDIFVPTANAAGIDDLLIRVETDGAFVKGYGGTYTTPALDATVPVTLDAITWSVEAPAGTWIGLYARGSADGSTYSPWQPLAGNGSAPFVPGFRYFQVRANMTAPAAAAPVRLDWLAITYHGIAGLAWSTGGGPWSDLPLQSPWIFASPLQGGANTFTLRARDTTGAVASQSINLSRDVYPPSAPGTPQGPSITAAVSATWAWNAASDVGLGVDHYIVDAGTTPGGTDLVAGQRTGGTAYTIGVLPQVASVYFRVRAVDGAGLEGPMSAVSRATLVDRAPPGGSTFRGPGLYVNTSRVVFNWSEPDEVGSWVAYYIVLIGTAAGSASVADTTSTNASFEVSGLVSGHRYYASVVAVDAAGNLGPLVTSAGTLVDLDAPGPPGSLSAPSEWTNESSFGWTWGAAADPLTGIRGYRVGLGSARGLTDVITAEVPEGALTFTQGVDGHAYFISVAAVDLAGNVGLAVLGGPVRVDLSGPPAVVLPALGPFVAQPGLTIEWQPPVDLPAVGASGIDRYEVTVVEDRTPRTTLRASNYTQLSLREGLAYEVHVVAIDLAGNRGADAVVTFTTDMTGPSAPTGLGLQGASAGGQMTVAWRAAEDAASGIFSYRVMVGSQVGRDDVLPATSVTGTSITFNGEAGKSYFVTVWAVDRAGNEGRPSQAGPFRAEDPSAISVTTPLGLLFVLAAAALATAAAGVAVRLIARHRTGAKKPPR